MLESGSLLWPLKFRVKVNWDRTSASVASKTDIVPCGAYNGLPGGRD